MQFGRGAVLDAPVGIDDGVDAAHQPGEEERLLRQGSQMGIGPSFVVFLLAEEPYDGVQGIQRAAQVEKFRLAQVKPRHRGAMERLADVKEPLGRQGVRLLAEDAHHLGRLVEQPCQRGAVVRKRHCLHPLTSHGGETPAAHLLAYQVKAYLMFVVLRINHSDNRFYYSSSAKTAREDSAKGGIFQIFLVFLSLTHTFAAKIRKQHETEGYFDYGCQQRHRLRHRRASGR